MSGRAWAVGKIRLSEKLAEADGLTKDQRNFENMAAYMQRIDTVDAIADSLRYSVESCRCYGMKPVEAFEQRLAACAEQLGEIHPLGEVLAITAAAYTAAADALP